MIAMLGQNPLGRVLHLIVGPETDLFMDINGSAVLDLTAMLPQLTAGNQHAFVSVTRTKSEAQTEKMMQAAGMAQVSGPGVPTGEQSASGVQAPPVQTKSQAEGLIMKSGKCEFCGSQARLLPIPGYNICPLCAQIEIGRNSNRG